MNRSLYWSICRKLSDYGVQRTADSSISVSESLIIKISGADDNSDKEILVSWNLQVIDISFVDD